MARRDPVSVGIRLLTRNAIKAGSMVFELSPEDGKAADLSASRSFIIRPFPLTGTTKIPARNDQTRAVPPKCAGEFLGSAK